MFVNKEHRNKLYKFIYNHLNKKCSTLIVSMQDGIKKYKSDVSKSFDDVERVVANNDEKINIAIISCNIVNWSTFKQELLSNDLIVKRKWISERIPKFNPAMCVIVCRKE